MAVKTCGASAGESGHPGNPQGARLKCACCSFEPEPHAKPYCTGKQIYLQQLRPSDRQPGIAGQSPGGLL